MDKNVGLHQNALESVGLPAPAWKGRRGRSAFIFCILEVLALDNPRTAVYNKDKERRWLHSGQLPFWMSDFIRKNDRSGWEVWGGHFLCRSSELCFVLGLSRKTSLEIIQVTCVTPMTTSAIKCSMFTTVFKTSMLDSSVQVGCGWHANIPEKIKSRPPPDLTPERSPTTCNADSAPLFLVDGIIITRISTLFNERGAPAARHKKRKRKTFQKPLTPLRSYGKIMPR